MQGSRLSMVLAPIVLLLAPMSSRAQAAPHAIAELRLSGQAVCPAEIARNSALGVALTIPPGWQEVSPTLFAHAFSPTALFLVVPTGEGNPRLLIEGLGTTTDTNARHAANTAADRLAHGLATPVTRQPTTVAGAPGVLLRGLPAQTPTVQLVIVHASAVYRFIAFGADRLQDDQQQALSSLRFIPRVGPFPSAMRPEPPLRLPMPTLALTLARAAGGAALITRAAGGGYHSNEVIELDTCWQGVPRPGLHPRYTYYTLRRIVQTGRDGILDTRLTIPIPPQAYSAYTLRTIACDNRIGYRLVAATTQG